MPCQSFEDWMREVDQELAKRLAGFTSSDLPDRPYYDWFETMLDPEEAAEEAIQYAFEN